MGTDAAPLAADEVRVEVTATGGEAARVRELHGLRSWLVTSGELGGQVDLVEPSAGAHTQGGLADALTVSVAAGGATTVLAKAVVAWVRSRTGQVRVTLQRGTTRVTLDAVAVSDLNAESLGTLVRQLSDDLSRDPGR